MVIHTNLKQLFPQAELTSNFVNRLYNKPVMRNGEIIGKIIEIEPDGDDYRVLMKIYSDKEHLVLKEEE